jgi:DNA-binding transcriptional MerR regulator
MRIAELSHRSNVPVATVKFYLREGLLPRGERTAPNQARYDETHLRRLALIRTLQRAGLSLTAIKRTLAAMDAMQGEASAFMTIALGALEPSWQTGSDDDLDPETRHQAVAMLQAMVRQRGWQVDDRVPIWHEVVRALATIHTEWRPGLSSTGLDRYAEIIEELAVLEVPETWNPVAAPADALTYAIEGTVLFEPLILALRRLAHVDRGNRLRAERTSAVAHPGGEGTTPNARW